MVNILISLIRGGYRLISDLFTSVPISLPVSQQRIRPTPYLKRSISKRNLHFVHKNDTLKQEMIKVDWNLFYGQYIYFDSDKNMRGDDYERLYMIV